MHYRYFDWAEMGKLKGTVVFTKSFALRKSRQLNLKNLGRARDRP